MSNRASLINTPLPTSDPGELQRARLARLHSYVEIAEAANRIPIPWLACFQAADLKHVTYQRQVGRTEFETVQLRLPYTTVAAARRNIESSLPLYEAIFGTNADVRSYWLRAVEGLGELPFEFLTMNPVEVLALNDLASEVEALASSLSAMPERVEYVKQLANVQDGFLPYTAAEYFDGPPEALDHGARVNNSAALDPGYSAPESRLWFRPEEQAPAPSGAQPKKPWWRRW
jgi:hypothetical protein